MAFEDLSSLLLALTVLARWVPRSLGGDGALAELSGHYWGVRAIEYHPTAPLLASAAGPSELFFWDLNTHQKVGHSRA